MNKTIKRLVLLLMVVCMLSACSIPFAYPDGGVFYCEELQMTLDFSSADNKATFVYNGEEVTGRFETGYDGHIYVKYTQFTADGPVYHDVMDGEFQYRAGKVTIKTDSEEKYTFLPVEK